MTVKIIGDYTEMDRTLSKLASMPDDEMAAALDTLFGMGYTLSQGIVHVISGDLKASGTDHTEHEGVTWKGELEYGPGTELTSPDHVDYAWYEQRRGGTHDFMRLVPTIEEGMAGAIDEGLGNA